MTEKSIDELDWSWEEGFPSLPTCTECQEEFNKGIRVTLPLNKYMNVCSECAKKDSTLKGAEIDEPIYVVKTSQISEMSYENNSCLQGGMYIYMYNLWFLYDEEKGKHFSGVCHLDKIVRIAKAIGDKPSQYSEFAVERYKESLKHNPLRVGERITLTKNLVVEVDTIREPKKKRLVIEYYEEDEVCVKNELRMMNKRVNIINE